MSLPADESVARAIIDRLRTDGHTVLAIAEASPGVADTQVLEQADRTQAVLPTETRISVSWCTIVAPHTMALC